MAKAKTGQRQTSRKVTLKLTEGEADMLVGVLAQVSGHPTRTPRKYAERVRNALEGALGYTYLETDAFALSLGDIEFREYGDVPVTEEDRVIDFVMHGEVSSEVVDEQGYAWTVAG